MRHFLLLMIATVLAFEVSAASGRVYVEDFDIEPGRIDTVTVMLFTSEPSRGLQFYITLPSGVDLWDFEMSDLSNRLHMVGSCNYSSTYQCYSAFIYPNVVDFYPADTLVAVMDLYLEADPTFRESDLITWKCRGSTADNETIYLDGDTAHVSLPGASIIAIPDDDRPMWEQYYNLNGQPIDSPDSTSVAIQVTTGRSGERKARKVAVSH